MTALVFIDTETTGLDPRRHTIWEAAFAGETAEVRSSLVMHELSTADPTALRMNGYYDRCMRAAFDPVGAIRFEEDLREALTGATLVAANPAFDAAFLATRWGASPWSYRLLDVEAYAMGALGYDRPRGLARIAEDLRARGHEIPTPDHSAAGDVATLRAAYLALRTIYTKETPSDA